MTSGIYLLEFGNPTEWNYIGKSNNIERRWKEHRTKLERGTAASNLMGAYYTYGMPRFSILMECHEDHIDLMENIYINQNWGSKLLNKTAPPLLSAEDQNTLIICKDLLKYSTADHLRVILKHVPE